MSRHIDDFHFLLISIIVILIIQWTLFHFETSSKRAVLILRIWVVLKAFCEWRCFPFITFLFFSFFLIYCTKMIKTILELFFKRFYFGFWHPHKQFLSMRTNLGHRSGCNGLMYKFPILAISFQSFHKSIILGFVPFANSFLSFCVDIHISFE